MRSKLIILTTTLAILVCSGCQSYGLQTTTISNEAYGWTVTHTTGPKRLTKTLEMAVKEDGTPHVIVEVEQVESQAAGLLGGLFKLLIGG